VATGELAAEVVEQVAEHLEEAAEVTRMIDTRAVGFFVSGSTFGIALGFIFGYRYNKERIKAEAFKESEAEVKKIREVYEQRLMAAKEKPSVEEVIEERGYSIVDSVLERVERPERPLRPPVPVQEPFVARTEEMEKSKNDGWDYPLELSRRTPDRPYIIHQDEFHLNESGYQQVVYSYYAGDGVFTDEHDTVLENIDNLLGLDNLTRWGHGSDDFNVLYIRNSAIQLEFEVCRTPKSYEEDVQGLEHSDYGSDYERMRRRHDRFDDDEPS
jgi:hypothetical protein